MPSALLDVGPIIGPLYIGSILNWMFTGILIMQYYTYYQTFPTDQLVLRILVNFLLVLDLVQTVTSTHFGWFFIVTTWGDKASLTELPWSASTIPILCGSVTAIVQIFYAWRIWVLAPNRGFKVMACVIVGLGLVQGITAVVAGARGLHNPSSAEGARAHTQDASRKWQLPLWLATSFVVDVLITASMSWILTRAKQQSNWRPTETMLTKLIHRVVQTGAASAICATIDLAMFVTYPTTNFHWAPAFILGKVYTNSLMLTLNLRRPTAPSKSAGDNSRISFRMEEPHRAGGVMITRTLDVEAAPGIWNQKGPAEYMPHRGVGDAV